MMKNIFRVDFRRFAVKFFIFLALLIMPITLNAQEDREDIEETAINESDSAFFESGFGFGDNSFGDSGGFGFSGGETLPSTFSTGSGFSAPSIRIGGEATAEFTCFFDYFDSAQKLKSSRPADVFSGSLNFEASGTASQAIINLNLTPVFDGSSSPVGIDEAYVRAFFGPVTVVGGLRKLTWGKADSFGPLDVVNPLDYSDLTKLTDPQSIKIARPMIHASWAPGAFTKLEAVFVPWFQGHKFAKSGRWAPSQMTGLAPAMAGGFEDFILSNPVVLLVNPALLNDLKVWQENFDINNYFWDHNYTLEYAQVGMRITSTVNSSDFGVQYYFGSLPRPRVNVNLGNFFDGLSNLPPQLDVNKISINVDYTYYHQFAIDFARVILGYNIRAEAGMNITSDVFGTDGEIENPAFVWSLGFDRDLFWRINLNLQGAGKIRFAHIMIGNNFLEDCEAGTTLSSTRITGKLSRKILREEIELKTTALWGIEDRDFLIMPSFIWSRNDVSTELSAGFFGGDKNGELGQYRDNAFMRMILTYKF